MIKPAFQKIYVILGKQDKEQLEGLCHILSDLFPYANFTSNLYLVTENLPQGMPQVERIQKEVCGFIRSNLFARLYVHFVHGVSPATPKEIEFFYQYFYQGWKRGVHDFDREAYMHQEVPRLMLLPVIVPDAKIEASSLRLLLNMLKDAFLLPSLYLDWSTFFLASDDAVIAKAEKVYYGNGKDRGQAEIVCGLCHEDVLHDTSAKLESDSIFMTHPCPAALIISALDGMVYPCVNAFLKKESLANIHDELDIDTLMDRYGQYMNSQKGCLSCREQVAVTFADLPLPKGARHEVGDLLYNFGVLHQEAENHVQAVELYEKSLKLSYTEEMGPVLFRLGLSYTRTGRYDQALEAFRTAELTYHDQYYFHFYMGVCCFEIGDYGVAIERFSKAVEMDPPDEDLARILIYMGTCYNNLGEYQQAQVPLERAKEMAPSVKEIFSSLGFSYFQLRDYDKAIENLGRAVEIDPDSAIDYASLGASYREKGDTIKAMAMYEKALTLDPGMASARENLERLSGKT